MEISVTLRRIIIKDAESGAAYTVSTLRTAKDIADIVEETEREEAVQQLSDAVWEAYQQHPIKETDND